VNLFRWQRFLRLAAP